MRTIQAEDVFQRPEHLHRRASGIGAEKDLESRRSACDDSKQVRHSVYRSVHFDIKMVSTNLFRQSTCTVARLVAAVHGSHIHRREHGLGQLSGALYGRGRCQLRDAASV